MDSMALISGKANAGGLLKMPFVSYIAAEFFSDEGVMRFFKKAKVKQSPKVGAFPSPKLFAFGSSWAS